MKLPKVTLLIGHRGVGKTTLLARLQEAAKAAGTGNVATRFYNLDSEIENDAGKSLPEIWLEGEARFRDRERLVLGRLMHEEGGPCVIAVGAGFLGPIPDGAHVVWVRRATDSTGRSFLGRPRLNTNVSPFAEYLERFPERDARFRAWADEELTLPEGDDGRLVDFFNSQNRWSVPFDMTLKPEALRSPEIFFAKRARWGIRRWELRDDLLTEEQITIARQHIPASQLLFASRRTTLLPEDLAVDWPLERGEPPAGGVDVLSAHEHANGVQGAADHLSSLAARADILKLAVEVNSFAELMIGHRWWLAEPTKRAFMPRSKNGRWQWYRILFGPKMPLHYVREGDGSAPDQPWLWQTLRPRLGEKGFAAVLGNPVLQSRTPTEHLPFFKNRKTPIVAIPLNEDEWHDAMPVLRELGLTHAAVTAPLKRLAYELATENSALAEELHAANTLFIAGTRVCAHNTDAVALSTLAEDMIAYDKVHLWGGGGTKPGVLRAFPKAIAYSARSGTSTFSARSHTSTSPMGDGEPDLLIWATGRARPFQWPCVRPRLVLDLNYTEDSPGLEWAVSENLPYQSGMKMFKLQAKAQRTWWRTFEAGAQAGPTNDMDETNAK